MTDPDPSTKAMRDYREPTEDVPKGKKWDFDEEISGSFAEQRWQWFKTNPEGFRARYGEKTYQDYVEKSEADDV